VSFSASWSPSSVPRPSLKVCLWYSKILHPCKSSLLPFALPHAPPFLKPFLPGVFIAWNAYPRQVSKPQTQKRCLASVSNARNAYPRSNPKPYGEGFLCAKRVPQMRQQALPSNDVVGHQNEDPPKKESKVDSGIAGVGGGRHATHPSFKNPKP
jgi:hypothetical protein